ncbi:hypothetical protein [Arthrobacter sp. RCC_34]|uniref:hypothetical protein n=1 Tax=Arthrobacter sp. RCC_34 TaxID=3239230 RepID=UPI0035241731
MNETQPSGAPEVASSLRVIEQGRATYVFGTDHPGVADAAVPEGRSKQRAEPGWWTIGDRIEWSQTRDGAEFGYRFA